MLRSLMFLFIGLVSSTSALAHKVPYKDKYYLKIAGNDGYKAMKLDHFCEMWSDVKLCKKQLEIWKTEPARIEAAVSCQEQLYRWKFDPGELKPSIGIWNVGYYEKSKAIPEPHRFTWGPVAREKARNRALVQEMLFMSAMHDSTFDQAAMKKWRSDYEKRMQSAYDNPIYSLEPNQICFEDEEYCRGDELAVRNDMYKGEKAAIPKSKPTTLVQSDEFIDKQQIECAENRYKVLTNPDRDKILARESKRAIVKVQKEQLLADQEICDAAYFGLEFCKSAKNLMPKLRILE